MPPTVTHVENKNGGSKPRPYDKEYGHGPRSLSYECEPSAKNDCDFALYLLFIDSETVVFLQDVCYNLIGR